MSDDQQIKTDALGAAMAAFQGSLPEGMEAVAGFLFASDGKEIRMMHAVRTHRRKGDDATMKRRLLKSLKAFIVDIENEWSK